jgi:hypothetical protein
MALDTKIESNTDCYALVFARHAGLDPASRGIQGSNGLDPGFRRDD